MLLNAGPDMAVAWNGLQFDIPLNRPSLLLEVFLANLRW